MQSGATREQGNAAITNESELYLAPGGAMFRLMQRIGVARTLGHSAARRVVCFILITWVPMCVFALIQGNALGATPRGSFLLDYATYARFFVGIPILVFAETFIGPSLTRAGLEFVRSGLVPPAGYSGFEQAIARLARWRESVPATLAILALAAFGAWNLTAQATSGVGIAGWQSLTLPEGPTFRYSLAALWNLYVAVPMLLFLLCRWLWRIVIWTRFLRDVAQMKLELVPTHADGAGGLGFLEIAHQSFGNIAFGMSVVLSASAAFRIVYEGAKLDTFYAPLGGLLVLTQLLFLGPLLVVSPLMARTRRAALMTYGALVTRYNREFEKKWIESAGPKNEQFMGSADIQSLADLGNSYRFVSDMRATPCGKWAVIQLAVATALPILPLFLLVMPLQEILSALAGLVF